MADKRKGDGPTVILGVGNRLRGDDAIGSLVIEELRDGVPAVLFDSGATPESYLEPIIQLAPRRILIVDACAFGGAPGEFRLFSGEEIARISSGNVSTHTLPLSLLAAMLGNCTTADIWLLGIQPLQVGFGLPMSQPVAEALPRVVRFCRDWALGLI